MIWGIIVAIAMTVFVLLIAIWCVCVIFDFDRAEDFFGKMILAWVIFILLAILVVATIAIVGALMAL